LPQGRWCPLNVSEDANRAVGACRQIRDGDLELTARRLVDVRPTYGIGRSQRSSSASGDPPVSPRSTPSGFTG
jgi:hypothetical protein